MASEDKDRHRKKNWSGVEVEELRSGYLEFQTIKDGKLSICLTHMDKENAWKTIQSRVNSQACESRTVPELKKKLSDVKSAFKKAERERRFKMKGTGGGPPPSPLSLLDEKMLEAVGDVAVVGFSGVDTFNTINPAAFSPAFSTFGTFGERFSPILRPQAVSATMKENEDPKVLEHNPIVDLLTEQNRLIGQVLEEIKKTNSLLKHKF